MSTPNEVLMQAKAAHDAGDAVNAQKAMDLYRYLIDPARGNYQAPHNPAADMPAMDPSAGGSTLNLAGFDTGLKTPEVVDRTLSGMGQAVANAGRGLGQMVGLESRGDVANARKLDAPLDATTAGTVGNFIGNAGMIALPAVAGPAITGGFLAQTGINAAAGAGVGLMQPSVSTNETLRNVGLGAVGGGLTPAIGRVAQSVYQGGKALVEPFTQSGQQNIAGRILQQFAGSPQDAQAAAAALRSATPGLPNVQLTTGMAGNNGGLATLERSMANNPEFTTDFTRRKQQNANAILDAVQGIAGDPGQRAFYAADRSAAADALYGKARASYDPANVTPEVQAQIDSLLQRPSITEGSKAAQRIAQERGQVPDPNGSLGALHDVKTALDDQISSLKAAGKNKEAASVLGTQNRLLQVLESLSPDYATARSTFTEMSKPINRMDVGQAMLDKLSPALNDYRNTPTLHADAFTNALRNPDKLAQQATGFPGAKLENILTPEDLRTIEGVKGTLGQIANAQDGKAIGSPTAQNMISQNLIGQIAGPLGLPQNWMQNTIAQTLARPIQFAGQIAEPKITTILGKAMLEPKQAADLLTRIQTTSDPKLRNALARILLTGGRAEAASLSQ